MLEPFPISLDPRAHYKVQTAAYERLQVGRALTDRRIRHYQERGFYGSGIVALQRKEKIAATRTKKKPFSLNDFV